MKVSSEALTRVEIVPYDQNWSFLFHTEQLLVRSLLSSLVCEIEHIGSTAVPNLSAKPIIDIMASSHSLPEFPAAGQRLASVGYSLIETGMRNRHLFRRSAEPSGQMYHLHIVGTETWSGRKERIMRDYLLNHPDDAAAYGLLKEKLATVFFQDSLGYTQAKTEFIQDLMNKACDEIGMARMNVWTD